MPRRADKASLFPWHKITGAQAVARLFPDAGASGVDLSSLAPGRYWPAWEFPKNDQTDLDRAIRGIVEGTGRTRFRTREDLAGRGITCPYYAWRLHTSYAALHATNNFWSFTRNRMETLANELKAWEERIRATQRLLDLDPDIALPSGSIYLGANDLGGTDPQETLILRMNCIREMRTEIGRDQAIKASVEAEMFRLKSLLEGRSGANAPDLWRTPFYTYLANLWVHMTDSGSPDPAGTLGEILSIATRVISGGNDSIYEWGQYRKIRERFLSLPAGEGFTIGERGIFKLNTGEVVGDRGAEISFLYDIIEDKIASEERHKVFAEATILLADYSPDPLLIILRELVMKGILQRSNIIGPDRMHRLMLQLGWVRACGIKKISDSVEYALKSASNGDLTAIIVVEVASWTDEASQFITRSKWPVSYGGRPYEDFLDEHERLSLQSETESTFVDKLTAFEVAMSIASLVSAQVPSRRDTGSGRLKFERRGLNRPN